MTDIIVTAVPEDPTVSTCGGFLQAPFNSRKRGIGKPRDSVAQYPLSPAFALMLGRVHRPGMDVWAWKTRLAPKE